MNFEQLEKYCNDKECRAMGVRRIFNGGLHGWSFMLFPKASKMVEYHVETFEEGVRRVKRYFGEEAPLKKVEVMDDMFM